MEVVIAGETKEPVTLETGTAPEVETIVVVVRIGAVVSETEDAVHNLNTSISNHITPNSRNRHKNNITRSSSNFHCNSSSSSSRSSSSSSSSSIFHKNNSSCHSGISNICRIRSQGDGSHRFVRGTVNQGM